MPQSGSEDMNKLLTASLLALSVALTAPAKAATDLPLSPEIAAQLTAANDAAAVAEIIRNAPARLAATIMAQANAQGIASPSQVLAQLITLTTPISAVSGLVAAAAEAAPSQADVAAGQAYTSAGRNNPALATAIATNAVDGVEAAGLPSEQVNAEAVEIAAALRDRAPANQAQAIADAVADATDSGADTGQDIASAANEISEIEVADTNPGGNTLPSQRQQGVPSFVDLPSAAQNNPGTGNSAN